MAISYDYIKHMPKALPKGMLDHIRNVILKEDNVLLYNRDRPKSGYCYLCGNDVIKPVGRFYSNQMVTCPICGERVHTFLSDGNNYRVDYITNLVTIQKDRRGVVWLREWHLMRGQTNAFTKKQLVEVEAWAIQGKEVFKWALEEKIAWTMMNYDRYRHEDYFKSRRIVHTIDGFYSFYLPADWRQIIEGTSLQYLDLEAAVEKIRYVNVLRLCLDWARYPAVEKLQKAGFTRLVHEKLDGFDHFKSIRWKNNTVEGALGFPLRLLPLNDRAGLGLEAASKYKYFYSLVNKGQIREEDIEGFVKDPHISVHDVRSVLDLYDGLKLGAVMNYIGKQLKASPRGNMLDYRDYLKDCIKLGLDLTDRKVLFPKNLYNAHQRTIKLVKYEAAKENEERFTKAVEPLQKMSYANGLYLIRPAASERELIDEGAALQHCVAGYTTRILRGETSIFFIRKAAEPEKPFYTLEYRNGKIIQCRKKENISYTLDPDISAFVECWLDYLNKKNKKKKPKEVAV